LERGGGGEEEEEEEEVLCALARVFFLLRERDFERELSSSLT